MREVTSSILRRLRLPYTAVHKELAPFKEGYVSRACVTRSDLVERYLEITSSYVLAYDKTPCQITLSIGGRIATDRFIRDTKGRWTHHDLIGGKTTALQYRPLT